MTGPDPETQDPEGRPISVAELLAKNGTLGAPAVTRRRRRRRGDNDAVSVAELTGEIPIVDDEVDDAPALEDGAAARGDAYWSEPEPRWPKSPPQAKRPSGPQLSAYPRPLRRDDEAERPEDTPGPKQSGAEGMSPDPVEHYGDMPVDVMDSEVSEAEPATEDSAYVRSYLQAPEGTLFGGQTLADELARRRGDEAARDAASPAEDLDEDLDEHHEARRSHARLEALWHGTVVVLQSMLAVAFGAGLFIAFDQLWRWNSIVTLVLSVLVILGLVVGVRVVRKTEDIASTLIAVAVGALITWGPLVLSLQTG
jgi:hypothetical protein